MAKERDENKERESQEERTKHMSRASDLNRKAAQSGKGSDKQRPNTTNSTGPRRDDDDED